MTRLQRALFVNQGPIGGGQIMGHVATEQALRFGFADLPDVQARFVRLPPWSRRQRLAASSIPGLSERNFDFQVTRWHLMEAQRTRQIVARQVQEWAPDVVHINSHVAAMTLGQASGGRPMFVAVDVTVGDHEAGRGKRWLSPSLALERRTFDAAAGVFAYNQVAAEAVARVAPRARIQVLHPGINLDSFSPGPARPDGPLKILFVGASFAAKGGFDLLEALGPLLGPKVELDVVCRDDPPVPPGVRVHHLEPGDPTLLALYQTADLFCLPSLHDANPWVIIEAMACALPVLATHVGSVGRLLTDSGAGLLVPAANPARLREALRVLLDDEQQRSTFARNARTYAEQNFDARRQARRLVEAMDAVLC